MPRQPPCYSSEMRSSVQQGGHVGVLSRIFSYLRPYKTRVVLAYLALFIGTGMQLAVPRLVEYVIDDGLVQANLRVVTLGSLAIIGAGVFQGAFTFLRSYLFQALAEQASFDIR